MKLSATEGYTFRFADAVISSSNRHLQIQNYTGGDRHPFVARPQDPGAPTISFQVNTIEAALNAVRTTGAHVLTRGGPVRIGDGSGSTALLIRGPDELLIELVEVER